MSEQARHDAPLKPRNREGVLAFWAAELGINLPELLSPNAGVYVCANHSNPGIMVFRRGTDVRISATPTRVERMHDELPFAKAGDFCCPDFWRSAFPELTGSIVGPARLYYMDAVPKTWTPPPTSRSLLLVRGLAASDLKICAEFANALTREEREISGFDTLGRHAWGVFARGTLVAVAGYDAWPHRIAHIGVATHPAHRGSKFAQLATQAALRGAVTRRRIAQYRCLTANAAADGVAKALGLSCFAETLFINQPSAKPV